MAVFVAGGLFFLAMCVYGALEAIFKWEGR
jgi:hypothetical protein